MTQAALAFSSNAVDRAKARQLQAAVHADPRLMEQVTADAPVWIIDPIDGTRNFAHGRATFAIMVALVQAGESLGGWILEPVSGRFGVAERGGGAWMGGQRLRVAAPDRPERMSGSLHASTYAPKEIARRVEQRRGRVQAVKSLRCAGAEYLRLAEGQTHFSLFTRLMPWDHVPGTLLHAEAGGVALCFDGTPYRAGRYREAFNSDAQIYGGSGHGNLGGVETAPIPAHGHWQSLSLVLPPLGAVLFVPE